MSSHANASASKLRSTRLRTELLRDVEIPGRYPVVDCRESRDAFNELVEANREETVW